MKFWLLRLFFNMTLLCSTIMLEDNTPTTLFEDASLTTLFEDDTHMVEDDNYSYYNYHINVWNEAVPYKALVHIYAKINGMQVNP